MTGEANSTAMHDVLVVLGAAGIVIPAFARFRITPVIGFILVGILVGPFGLGAVTSQFPWLSAITIRDPAGIAPVAELGIVLLLFSIGLELSVGRLWRMRRELLGYGAAELIFSSIFIAAILAFFGTSGSAAIGLGLALALSSTALVLPIAGSATPVGKLALAMLLFEDLALVPIIFALGVLASGGSADSWIELGRVAGLGVLVVGAMLALGPYVLPALFRQAARTKSPELFLAASLTVAILSGIATTVIGLSAIVGALVAGLLIAETKYREEVEVLIAPLKGLALGVFLISVGMSLDLGMVAERSGEIALAVLAVVLVKAVVTTFLLRAAGVARGLATETGVLMASPSETTLIVLAAAVAGGLISQQTASFWQVVTAIGLTITPLLARIGHDFARRLDPKSLAPARAIAAENGQTVLIGFGRVGRMVSDMLEAHNQPYVAIEADVDVADAAYRDGKPVRFGDAARPAMLELLDLGQARAVVLTMDDPVQAERITRHLRTTYPDLTIVARARDTDHAAALYRAGATDAVPETLESSLQLSEAVLVDLGVAMGPVIASIHEKRDELRAEIKKAGKLDDLPRLGPLRKRARQAEEQLPAAE
jgi:monovalent cation:H+ antiporter-2, CPA2 family